MNEDSITKIVDKEGEFWICGNDKKASGVLFLDAERVKLRIMHKITRYEPVDMADYAKTVIEMYDGEPQEVVLLCDNELMKRVIDKFERI